MLINMEFLPQGVRLWFVNSHDLAQAVDQTYYAVVEQISRENGLVNIPRDYLRPYQSQNAYLMGISVQQRLAETAGMVNIEIDQERPGMSMTDHGNFVFSKLAGIVTVKFTVTDLAVFTMWLLQHNLTGIIHNEHNFSTQFRNHMQHLSET